MPLRPINELIRHAREHRYALGYFESWNLESLQGVLDAAEATRSPIIIGFNGEFLSHSDRKLSERLQCYAELGKAAAACATVPCGLIFNECSDDEWVRNAVLAGFNLVMPADPAASYEDYRHRVAALTAFAHRYGVALEAEVGHLPTGTTGTRNGNHLTDPELAAAINLGVTKVNYGTYLKQRYLQAVRTSVAANVDNPHELLGIGGDRDVMVAGRFAVRDAVLERIGLLGCCGKAH